MAALSVLLVVMEVMLSVLMVVSLPQVLPVNTGRLGIYLIACCLAWVLHEEDKINRDGGGGRGVGGEG